nr:reverse transcriptase domain-containing protein [Tanacetum cinerariifolium]
MQTRYSSRLVSNPSSNPTPSKDPNPKGRNRRRSKQRIEEFNLDEIYPPIVTMADQRTMAQLLQASTEGYEDAIVVPAITADNFELKHGLLTMQVKEINDVTRLQALVDKKKVINTEATTRDALRLNDAEGIDCLPNEEIFAKLSRMRGHRGMSLVPLWLQLSSFHRVGKGFSRIDTPLFERMIVAQQVDESVAEVNVDDLPAAGVADEGVANVNADAVLTAADQPIIPSLTPTLHHHHHYKMYLPPPKRVENLKQDKIVQALEIIKLKHKVKKLERRNKLKASKLRRLKKIGTAQRVDTSDDTVMDDASKQGSVIADMDADVDVTLKDVADIAKEVAVDAEIEESEDVQRRQAESQAQIYQIDLEHADKLRTEVVTAASATITADTPTLTTTAAPTLTTAASRRKGVKYFNSNVAFLEKTKEQMEEKDSKALKRIMLNDEDDVYTEATPLAHKVSVVDDTIHTENNKPYFKIIGADGTHQLFLSFLSLLRNFNREDLEVLWELVKERFASSKPKNFLDDLLLTTLTYMFEKPDVQAQVWKNQRTVHGLAKMILLVERRYPLTRFTLDQMLNNVRLEVEEESEVSLELLRFISFRVDAAKDFKEKYAK